MPALLELQRAMRASIVELDASAIVESLATGSEPDRLDIYRNTIFFALTRALRLAFPAVELLVGGEFFASAADAFIREYLPRAAYLDLYGGEFPDFLSRFPPAISLPYLADVARLEWAVNRALHAPDETPLDLSRLAALVPDDQGRVSFRVHPSVSLLRSDFPVDDFWRAVLNSDDQALADLDFTSGPAFLLIERGPTGVEVTRLKKPAWRFLDVLCRSEPLFSAIDSADDIDAPGLLAEHLAAGRFVAFSLDANKASASPEAT
jgi:hypothetical protein